MFFVRKPWLYGISFSIIACRPALQTAVVQFNDYQITREAPVDSAYIRFLAPYSEKMKASMGKIIGFSIQGLSKKQPESAVGNFMADALKQMAEKKFSKKIDAALVNYGGVRSYLPKGNITVGQVFELMPFDNLLVLQELSGTVLQQLLDKTAADGGWPVAGIAMEIKDKKAMNVLVQGKPLELSGKYLVANSDYIANGGGDCFMLRGIAQQNKGYLVRDALLEYIDWMTTNGRSIDANIEKRVVNAN